jgi:hypothetical protein
MALDAGQRANLTVSEYVTMSKCQVVEMMSPEWTVSSPCRYAVVTIVMWISEVDTVKFRRQPAAPPESPSCLLASESSW